MTYCEFWCEIILTLRKFKKTVKNNRIHVSSANTPQSFAFKIKLMIAFNTENSLVLRLDVTFKFRFTSGLPDIRYIFMLA